MNRGPPCRSSGKPNLPCHSTAEVRQCDFRKILTCVQKDPAPNQTTAQQNNEHEHASCHRNQSLEVNDLRITPKPYMNLLMANGAATVVKRMTVHCWQYSFRKCLCRECCPPDHYPTKRAVTRFGLFQASTLSLSLHVSTVSDLNFNELPTDR